MRAEQGQQLAAAATVAVTSRRLVTQLTMPGKGQVTARSTRLILLLLLRLQHPKLLQDKCWRCSFLASSVPLQAMSGGLHGGGGGDGGDTYCGRTGGARMLLLLLLLLSLQHPLLLWACCNGCCHCQVFKR